MHLIVRRFCRRDAPWLAIVYSGCEPLQTAKVLHQWSPPRGVRLNAAVMGPNGLVVVIFGTIVAAFDTHLKEIWRWVSKKHNFTALSVCGGPESAMDVECMVVGTMGESQIVALNASTGTASPRTKYWPPHKKCLGYETLESDHKDFGGVVCMGECMGGTPPRPCVVLGLKYSIACIELSSLSTVWVCGTADRMDVADSQVAFLAVAGCDEGEAWFVVGCAQEGTIVTLDAQDGAILATKHVDAVTGDVAAPTARRCAICLPTDAAADASLSKSMPPALPGSVRVAVMPQGAAALGASGAKANPLAPRSAAGAASAAGQAADRDSDAASVSSATTAGGKRLEEEMIRSACIVPARLVAKQRGGAAVLALSEPQPPAVVAVTATADAWGAFAECLLAPMPQPGAAVMRPLRSPLGAAPAGTRHAPAAKAKHLRLWRAVRLGATVEAVAVDEAYGVAVVRTESRGLQAWSLVTGRELWRVSLKALRVDQPVRCGAFRIELNELAAEEAADGASEALPSGPVTTPPGNEAAVARSGLPGATTHAGRASPKVLAASGVSMPAVEEGATSGAAGVDMTVVGLEDGAELGVGLAAGTGRDADLAIDSMSELSGLSDLSWTNEDLLAAVPAQAAVAPTARAGGAAQDGPEPDKSTVTETKAYTMQSKAATCDASVEFLATHAGSGLLITTQDDSIVTARDVRTGEVLWRAIGGEASREYDIACFLAQVGTLGRVVIIVSSNGVVSVLRALDGSVVYRVIVTRAGVDLSSALWDDANKRLIVVDDDNRARACDVARRCAQLWTDPLGGKDSAVELELCRDTLLVWSHAATPAWIQAFDTGSGPITGRVANQAAAEAKVLWGHIDSTTAVMCYTGTGELWAVDSRTCDVLATHRVHSSTTVSGAVSGTLLQVLSDAGVSFFDAKSLRPLSVASFDARPALTSVTMIRLRSSPRAPSTLDGALSAALHPEAPPPSAVAASDPLDLGAPGAGWSPFPIFVGCLRCPRRSTQTGCAAWLGQVAPSMCGAACCRPAPQDEAKDPTHALVLGGSGEVFLVDVPLFLGPLKFAPSIDMAEIASLAVINEPDEDHDTGIADDGARAVPGMAAVAAKETDELKGSVSVANPMRALLGGTPAGAASPVPGTAGIGAEGTLPSPIDPPLTLGQRWRLYQASTSLLADVSISVISFLQLIAFAFQPAVPPSLEESATALDQVQSLGLGQITFGVVFFCALGAVIVFLLLLAVSEAIEEAKFRNPSRTLPNMCWSLSAVFVSLAVTVAQIPIWKILAQAFACTEGAGGPDSLVWSANTSVPCFTGAQIAYVVASAIAGVLLLPVAVRMLTVSAQLARLELVANPFDWSGDDRRAEAPDHVLSEASRHYPSTLVVLKAIFSVSAVLLASRPLGFGLVLLLGTLVQLLVLLVRPPHYFSEGNKFQVVQVAAFVFQNAMAVSAAAVEVQEAGQPVSPFLGSMRLVLSWSPLGLLLVIIAGSVLATVTPPLLPHAPASLAEAANAAAVPAAKTSGAAVAEEEQIT